MSAAEVLDRPLSLFAAGSGPVEVVSLDRRDANDLLVHWKHELGGCDRPFGQDQWGLAVNNRIVSLAVTASLVSPTITDHEGREWPRKKVAELARLCTAPGERWATRVMLRLWREVLVHEWEHWPVQLAASYETPGHNGNIYRFDGWTRVRKVKRSSPGKGSTWAKPSATDAIGDGRKTLWTYDYEAAS